MSLPCRAYARRGRVVLVSVPDGVDIDERPLRKRGIEQVPSLATVVTPSTSTVVHRGAPMALAGAVVDARLLGERPVRG